MNNHSFFAVLELLSLVERRVLKGVESLLSALQPCATFIWKEESQICEFETIPVEIISLGFRFSKVVKFEFKEN